MKLGWSPEMLRTKRMVKRICIFAFEMASNTTTTLPQRPPEAARERKRDRRSITQGERMPSPMTEGEFRQAATFITEQQAHKRPDEHEQTLAASRA